MKDGEAAQLFQEPLFTRSETWKLSTSGLFRGERFLATGSVPLWSYHTHKTTLTPWMPALARHIGTAMAFNVSRAYLSTTPHTKLDYADILNPEVMKFGVESKRSCPTTSTERYKEALAESLREMRVLCEEETRAGDSARL
jgi:hypothetical protein